LIRLLAVLTMLAPLALALTGCGPSYSPNTYATNAAQQAAKVEPGVIAGVRKVQISASGTVGGVAGAAAGGVAGSQVGVGPTSAFGAIGGSLLGGIAGVATEHIVGDTNGFEYIVRQANGDMISVAQKDEKPLWVGEKVLVIAGPQARVVPDYTVPFEAPEKTAAKPSTPAPPAGSAGSAPHPASAATPQSPAPAATPPVPTASSVPPQLPEAFGSPSATPPPIITPPDVSLAPAPSASATPPAAAAKP
jgi:outer membrane lipoprotein SlyB